MIFRDLIEQISALRFVAEKMPLDSATGRRMLSLIPWVTDSNRLEDAFEEIAVAIDFISNPGNSKTVSRIDILLMQLRDIPLTLRNLDSGHHLQEIELFEIKNLLLIAVDLNHLLASTPLNDIINLPDLSEALPILDPDHTGASSFFIYDSYSEELAGLRRSLRGIQQNPEARNQEKEDALLSDIFRVEESIKAMLSKRLRKFAPLLISSLEKIGCLDLLLSKSRLAIEMHLCRPATDATKSEFTALFNPAVKVALSKKGRDYQPVDISIVPGTTIITGANMAGKSVTLKSVALAQAMAQLGFYVPAAKATIFPFERIITSIGDDQSEMSGLSSFAAEMLRINEIVNSAINGERILALIDEPARTTNPEEGRAIVDALAAILSDTLTHTLLTTHYSSLRNASRRLRVVGLSADALSRNEISPDSISQLIDYSLIEDSSDHAPREALTIATLLGINPSLISLAARQLTLHDK